MASPLTNPSLSSNFLGTQLFLSNFPPTPKTLPRKFIITQSIFNQNPNKSTIVPNHAARPRSIRRHPPQLLHRRRRKSFDGKSIYKHSPSSKRCCLETEPKILHLLFGCPSILRLQSAYEDDDCVHIVIGLCDGGDLFDRLSSGACFSKFDVAAVLTQLMAAVAYCHRLDVAHKDINEKVDVWSAGVIRMKRK